HEYVSAGGNLVVVPGGEELDPKWYWSRAAREIMPGKLVRRLTTTSEDGIPWAWPTTNPPPLIAPFWKWRREQGNLEYLKAGGQPKVNRFWKVEPDETATVIIRYADDKDNPPALLERNVNQGRVLLFTTRMDVKTENLYPGRIPMQWHNYWQ